MCPGQRRKRGNRLSACTQIQKQKKENGGKVRVLTKQFMLKLPLPGYAWSGSLCSQGSTEVPSLADLCTAVHLSRATHCWYWQCFLCSPLHSIDYSEGLFNFPICHVLKHFCAKYYPPLYQFDSTVIATIFLLSFWRISMVLVADCFNATVHILSII